VDPVNRRDSAGHDDALEESETYAPISRTLQKVRAIGGKVDCVIDAIEDAIACNTRFSVSGNAVDLFWCLAPITIDLTRRDDGITNSRGG
jgi:hypothetical protein